MKKQKFTSKLRLDKTTVVSFEAMFNVRGGAVRSEEPIPLTLDLQNCGTIDCVNDTVYDTCAYMSTNASNACPTNTQNGLTDFCGSNNEPTKLCVDTKTC